MKIKILTALLAITWSAWLGLAQNTDNTITTSKDYAIKFDAGIKWKLSSPEMLPGAAKVHNDPHEVELYFYGTDGSKWKAVKWEKQKP